MMKNAFYFMLKALLVQILTFLSQHFAYLEKSGLIRKLGLISKFTTSITIHILPNISRSKGNQTMKLSQLIEYSMSITFLEKSNTKCGGEASPRPFPAKSKLDISLDQQFEI